MMSEAGMADVVRHGQGRLRLCVREGFENLLAFKHAIDTRFPRFVLLQP